MATTKSLPENTIPSLEYLQTHQVNEAAKLIAEAFLHETEKEGASPMYAWILEDLMLNKDSIDPRKKQKEALTWLFQKNMQVQAENDAINNQKTSCRCAFRRVPNKEDPEMICFFILKEVSVGEDDRMEANNSSISTWTMLRNGILWFPILFGWRVFYRLLVTKNYYEDTLQNYLSRIQKEDPKRTSLLVLERMVVHPSLHGKGIGSYFLKEALSTSSSNNSGETLCLIETQTEQNTRFYEKKLGSRVLEKSIFPPSPNIFNWILEYRE